MNCVCCGQPVPWREQAAFDPDSHTVTWGNKHAVLGYKQSRIFEEMWNRPGHVFSRDYLAYVLNGDDCDCFTETLINVHICNIRRKIEGAPFSIETMQGTGYRLVRAK